ncbi:MAG: hypothetical protein E3J73_01110 [Candidatus Bathyarchaeum sp.]|nr:MAG: hypothetical protein E3J73_01110 [Candidatus Bathyarchaeum sp.]
MRLPTDPTKLKLLTREYILKHCRELEKKLDAFEKQVFSPHKIVCLVGSTRPECQGRYQQVNRELCLAGYLVVTVSLFKTDVEDIEKHRDLLESIHLQKIHLSDVVVLIHKDAIGTHTAMELDYCKKIGKPTVVFDTIDQTCKEIELLGGE